MGVVSPMDFFTLCCKKLLEPWLSLRQGLAWLVLCIGLTCAQADTRISQLNIVTTDATAQVSAQLAFDLPPPVEEALQRGVPLFFQAEVALYQERWYWADKQIAKSQRYWRLSYQPLTRRYRLQASNQPIAASGFGVGLAQTVDTLAEALASMQRIGSWTLTTGNLDPDARLRLEFVFKLDPNALLRPWLVGGGDNDWGLILQRNQSFRAGGRP